MVFKYIPCFDQIKTLFNETKSSILYLILIKTGYGGLKLGIGPNILAEKHKAPPQPGCFDE